MTPTDAAHGVGLRNRPNVFISTHMETQVFFNLKKNLFYRSDPDDRSCPIGIPI